MVYRPLHENWCSAMNGLQTFTLKWFPKACVRLVWKSRHRFALIWQLIILFISHNPAVWLQSLLCFGFNLCIYWIWYSDRILSPSIFNHRKSLTTTTNTMSWLINRQKPLEDKKKIAIARECNIKDKSHWKIASGEEKDETIKRKHLISSRSWLQETALLTPQNETLLRKYWLHTRQR